MFSNSLNHLRANTQEFSDQSVIYYLRKIRNCAVKSLWCELITYPKPGLVSLVDPGSHQDMDARTFFASIMSLRHYFFRIANLAMKGANFELLRTIGLEAEARMLIATHQINTHRGAIFNLGMLAAAAGYRYLHVNSPLSLGEIVVQTWGKELTAHRRKENSHGARVASMYQVGGAIEEVISGYSSVYQLALPVYRNILAQTSNYRLACVQTFFTLLANVQDTNLLHRGGWDGLRVAQDLSQTFLDAGGIFASDWESKAISVHQELVKLNLSPGGSADLLSACLFIHHFEADE